MKIEVVDLISRPRNSGGILWGSVIEVLARFGKTELWRTRGSSIKYRIGFQDYIPGELSLVSDADYHYRKYEPSLKTVLQEGGRVSKRTFVEHAEAINKFFGVTIAHLLNPKKTVLLTAATRPKAK